MNSGLYRLLCALKAADKKSFERKIEWLIGNRLCDYSTG